MGVPSKKWTLVSYVALVQTQLVLHSLVMSVYALDYKNPHSFASLYKGYSSP